MKREQVEKLEKRIRFYNQKYRIGKPEISDKAYDTLVAQLRKLDPYNNFLSGIEPVQISKDRKRKLPTQMKSLEKAKSTREFDNWLRRIARMGIDIRSLTILPKYDGISLLVDDSGNAYTRGGDENEGQLCNTHYKYLNCKKNRTHLTAGEAVMTWKVFEKYSNYKHPRNLVSGIFTADEINVEILRDIDFIRYSDCGESESGSFYRLICEMNRYYGNGIQPITASISEMSREYLAEIYRKWVVQYPIDGLVFYVDDMSVWGKLGRLENGNPLYAIAYKDENFCQSVTTMVEGVTARVSKNGYLRPTIQIASVKLDGAEISNPTGNNFRFIFDNNIAKYSKIEVIRSGGVIPKVIGCVRHFDEEVEELRKQFSVCPHCGTPTRWNETKTDLVCPNRNCNGRISAKIAFFYTTMGCDGIGEETLKKVASVFPSIRECLNVDRGELKNIGLGDVISDTLLQVNDRILNTHHPIALLMHALDTFEGIGEKSAETILNSFSVEDQERLLNGEELNISVAGIGDKKKQAFYDGMQDFISLVKENHLKYSLIQKQENEGGLQGFSFCFSGFRDKELEKRIESIGGKIVSGVSRNTTHLVLKDLTSNSSKAEKAKQLNIEIININQLKDLLDENI